MGKTVSPDVGNVARTRAIRIVSLLAVLAGVSVLFVTASRGGTPPPTPFSAQGSLKSGATSFVVKSIDPYKVILYPEAYPVRSSYAAVCLKGTTVSSLARSFSTAGTRNLLYLIPRRQDVCWFTVSGATPTDRGQIVVDVTPRGS